MTNPRPLQRRDFLKSATAASVLVGAAPLVARADEPEKQSGQTPAGESQGSGGQAMVGMEAADCLAELIRGMENVRSINVFEAPLPPKPQKRNIQNGSYYDPNPKRPIARTAEDEAILAKALKLREDSKIPFWDAVLIVCQDQQTVPSGLLDAALNHGGAAKSGKSQSVTRAQLLAGAVKQMCEAKPDSNWIGMTSDVVLTDGSLAHLALLDFRCPITAANRRLVTEITKRLLPGGAAILEAGKVYQAYGRATVPAKSLAPLLGKALLFGNVINQRYVAHQLIDGKCAVRLSAGNSKKSVPVCVAVV